MDSVNSKQAEINENEYLFKNEPKICNKEEIDHYQIDNEYILKGYRVNFNTIPRTIKSLFLLHNESFNVWSHLIGVFFIIFLIFFTYLSITRNDKLIFNYQNLNNTLNISYYSERLNFSNLYTK